MGRSQINYLFTYKHDLKYWGLLPVNPQVPGSSQGRVANIHKCLGIFPKSASSKCRGIVGKFCLGITYNPQAHSLRQALASAQMTLGGIKMGIGDASQCCQQ